MFKFLAFLKLIRVKNCLLAFLATMLGAYLAWFEPNYMSSLLASFISFLICAFGNLINDVVDQEIDRINHPERILITGALKGTTAIFYAIVFALLGLGLAFYLNIELFVIVFLSVILLLLYNLYLKQKLILGNLIVAILSGLTLIVGGLAVEPKMVFTMTGPLIPAVFAFLFHIIREIVKDIQDINGDRQAGFNTLPIQIGIKQSLSIALILMLLLNVMIIFVSLTPWYEEIFHVIALYLIGLPALGLMIFVWGFTSEKMLAITSSALKIGMLLGLAAFFLGRWY